LQIKNAHSLANLEVASLISLLKFKNKLSEKEIRSLVSSDEIYVPLSICSTKLSLFEVVVKFLREELHLKNKEISELTKRDFRTVSSTYLSASEKQPEPFSNIEYSISFPLSVLASRNFSILETIVLYLHETVHLSFKSIAEILHRNYQTVWTVARRAKLK
jgi:hypothetical protein